MPRSKQPSPYIAISDTWYHDDAILAIEPPDLRFEAWYLFTALIGRASVRNSDGLLHRQRDILITMMGAPVRVDDCLAALAAVGVITYTDDEIEIVNYSRWQKTAEERARLSAAGQRGGQASVESRRTGTAPAPTGPATPTAAPATAPAPVAPGDGPQGRAAAIVAECYPDASTRLRDRMTRDLARAFTDNPRLPDGPMRTFVAQAAEATSPSGYWGALDKRVEAVLADMPAAPAFAGPALSPEEQIEKGKRLLGNLPPLRGGVDAEDGAA